MRIRVSAGDDNTYTLHSSTEKPEQPRIRVSAGDDNTYTLHSSTEKPEQPGWHWALHKGMGWVLVWVYPPKLKFVKDVTFALTARGPGGLYRGVCNYTQFIPLGQPYADDAKPIPSGYVSRDSLMKLLAMKGVAFPDP